MTCYPATGSLKPKSITPVADWFEQFGGWKGKSTMMLERTFPLTVDDSFPPPISELLKSLHRFFRAYTLKAMNFDFDGWCPEPGEAYDGFLGNLNDTIDGLRVYEHIENSGPEPTFTDLQTATPPTHDFTSDDSALHHRDSIGLDSLYSVSTFITGHRHPEHSSMSLVEGSPDKRMRSPSPGSLKQIESGSH